MEMRSSRLRASKTYEEHYWSPIAGTVRPNQEDNAGDVETHLSQDTTVWSVHADFFIHARWKGSLYTRRSFIFCNKVSWGIERYEQRACAPPWYRPSRSVPCAQFPPRHMWTYQLERAQSTRVLFRKLPKWARKDGPIKHQRTSP